MPKQLMTYGDAIRRLEVYRELHGSKLDAPWKKNPNLNLLSYINHWIGLFSTKPDDEPVTPIVARNMTKLTPERPSVAKVAGVGLTSGDLTALLEGETIIREVVPGVVARIKKHA